MNTKGSVTVLFLCFFSLFILTECSTCRIKKLEGESLSLTLTDRSLKEDDKFTMTKDNKIVLKKNTMKSTPWTLKNNVLELQHVTLNYTGTYTIELFDVKGIQIKTHSEIVCVYAKVPKPRVNITCQNEKVNFRCDVEGGKDQTYRWSRNGKEIKDAASNVLTNIDEDHLKYTCTVENPVHKHTSDPVEAACSTTLLLFGFDLWIMVGILGGGGALVLLLMITLVTLACRSCKRKAKQQRDEEELRLNYLNTSPQNGHQKSKQTARGQPAPPEPYDDVSAQEVPSETESKPRTQQRARPPPPPVEDDEEQPPPLPQPRTKAHPKKRERSM